MLVCGVVQQIVSNVFRLMQQFVLWNAANPRKSAVDLMYAVIRMKFVVHPVITAARTPVRVGESVVVRLPAVVPVRNVVSQRKASAVQHLKFVTLTLVPLAVHLNVQFLVMISVVCPIPVVVVTDFAQKVLGVVMM